MKAVYPIIIFPQTEGEEYRTVYIPDFDSCTEGKDLADCLFMARDAISLMGVTMEDSGEEIPAPSETVGTVSIDIPEGAIRTLIDVDFDSYRRSLDNKPVCKRCTIPSWLNEKAEGAHINFSQVLQDALKAALNIGS